MNPRPLSRPMSDRERVERFLRSKLKAAGRTIGQAERAYRRGQERSQLPRDEYDRAQIVCRRYVERRAVHLDDDNRPECFDADHPACEGCVEDIHAGCIETWE